MLRIASHIRVNTAWTAAVEKRLLVWIAERLPHWVTSDGLSLVGLAGMCGAGLSFAAFRITPWAAAAVVVSLVANWFGDSLDGTLARVRRQERPRFGYYVDHALDLAGTTVLMTGIACSGLMNPALAAAVLAAYLLISAESFLATHASGRFRMSFLGFGPTELRAVLAAGAVKAAASPWIHVFGRAVRLFDAGGAIAVIGFCMAFAMAAIRNAATLRREERRLSEQTPPLCGTIAGREDTDARVARADGCNAHAGALQRRGVAVRAQIRWHPAARVQARR